MKALITGKTKLAGAIISEFHEEQIMDEVIEFESCRVGENIPWKHYDIFINNACVGFSQAELLNDVFHEWRDDPNKLIINISSLAALKPYPLVGYKTTKAAVIAFTEQIAANYARYGIRANVILPGLMETPMAVEGQTGRKTREEVVAERDAMVPLGRKMGSAWDVANAALFLASDLAQYITGAVLPVDGGLSVS